MRTLYRASLAFLLTDMYTKDPIENAVVLCDGKQIRYTKKRGGYYVFSDLYPKEYRIDIICKGFLDVRLDLKVQANVTKTIKMDLPYSAENTFIQRQKRFEIYVNVNGELWKNKDVRLKLKNDLNFLKLVKPVKAKSNAISLNIANNKSFTFQRYAYNNSGTENEFYIYGYNLLKSKYLLEEPVKASLAPGGSLYPIWDLKTDDKGRMILPILRQFMKAGKAEFEVFADGKYARMKLSVPEEDASEKLITAETDLTELAPPPLPIALEKPKEEESTLDKGKGKSKKKGKGKGKNNAELSQQTQNQDEKLENMIDDTEGEDEGLSFGEESSGEDKGLSFGEENLGEDEGLSFGEEVKGGDKEDKSTQKIKGDNKNINAESEKLENKIDDTEGEEISKADEKTSQNSGTFSGAQGNVSNSLSTEMAEAEAIEDSIHEFKKE